MFAVNLRKQKKQEILKIRREKIKRSKPIIYIDPTLKIQSPEHLFSVIEQLIGLYNDKNESILAILD